MKASDVWIYLLIGGVLVWWIFGRQVKNVVELGPNATVGGKPVDTRYKGPLETAPAEVPNAAQDYTDASTLLANPWAYL